MSASMNSAISEFVLNRAQLMKRDPADCLWIGDLIAAFINSQEYAQTKSDAGKMSFSVQELRPEVLAFALLMEARLREKDADRGGNSWKTATCDDLMVRTFATCMVLSQQVRLHADAKIRKAVDLANYAMMIVDVAGALEAPALEIPAFLRTHKDQQS